MNRPPNAVINSVFGKLQGVSLPELLYKDLLKITLDVPCDYYIDYFKRVFE